MIAERVNALLGWIFHCIATWFGQCIASWDWFWFTPQRSETLAVIRIATGAMMTYMHLVLATDLMAFVGPNAWIDAETARNLHDGTYGQFDLGRSYLWHIASPGLLWLHHAFAITVSIAFAAGLLTRVSSVLAWFVMLMYIHRLTGAMFGLDQIVVYAAMYVMLAPTGSCFSLDAVLRRRFQSKHSSSRVLRWLLPDNRPTVSAAIATRLFQIHLCVIYLFGGLAKARGESWWDGTAMWFAIANYEYQSFDMTWMATWPRLFSFLTHLTLFWEIFYCALVWPKLSRPVVLALAVGVHGGIALFMGMMTFGCMMIVANMIFVPPELLHKSSSTGS